MNDRRCNADGLILSACLLLMAGELIPQSVNAESRCNTGLEDSVIQAQIRTELEPASGTTIHVLTSSTKGLIGDKITRVKGLSTDLANRREVEKWPPDALEALRRHASCNLTEKPYAISCAGLTGCVPISNSEFDTIEANLSAGWEVFKKENPTSRGVMSISRPGISGSSEYAVTESEIQSGVFFSRGATIWKRTNGEWREWVHVFLGVH